MVEKAPLSEVRDSSGGFVDAYARRDNVQANAHSRTGLAAMTKLLLNHSNNVEDSSEYGAKLFGKRHDTTDWDIDRKVSTIISTSCHPYRNCQRSLSTRDVRNAIGHPDESVYGFRIDDRRRHVLVMGVRGTQHFPAWIAEFDVEDLCSAVEQELNA